MSESVASCLTPAEFDLIRHGTLRLDLARRVKEHLELCPACRDQLDQPRKFSGPGSFRAPLSAEPPALDGYVLERWLGRGGCGDVWLSYYKPLAQERALKVLRAARFNAAGLEQVRREARLMAALKPHRNRVQIYDLIEQGDVAVLAMAYIAGGPLTHQVPLRWERAVQFTADAADGLAEMHSHGILHRDVKPDNLLWDHERDTVLVGDFGLAAHADQLWEEGWTLGYAAPEVLRGKGEARSDVFSLAATLFYLLLGEAPFGTDDRESSLAAAQAGLLDVPELDWFPRPLVELLHEGLAPDATSRPGLLEFQERLRRLPQEVLGEKLRQDSTRAGCPVNLRIVASLADPQQREFRRVLCCDSVTPAGSQPPTIRARTGDLLRLEATSDVKGYLTVLVFSATGETELLLPARLTPDDPLYPGEVKRLSIQLLPPGGSEKAALIWTGRPVRLSAAEWGRRIRAGEVGQAHVAGPGAVRGLALVSQESVPVGTDWTAVVLDVDHQG